MTSPAYFQLFGIRHHGPGSARSLHMALQAMQPDLILIEGPPDAQHLLPMVAHAQMTPPVAILVYNPRQLRQASFFPFAEFSPEWRAILFGLEHAIPVEFMDLPMSQMFLLREPDTQLNLNLPGAALIEPEPDPIQRIAALSGYTDPERWWDALLERQGNEQAIFPTILDLMQALRDDKTQPETRETLLREAYMRQRIRAAHQAGYQRVAVVCGAWHTPALATLEQIKPSADAALLKGLKKTKTQATWIPWSFDRLATQSGYSAGVLAPAWYRLLFNMRREAIAGSENAVVHWLTQAAQLLRSQDLTPSSAHVIEAVRLAETLAALRRTTFPGVEELREAAVTVLCEGAEQQLALIDQQLIIGDVLGAVPDTLPVPPLKADFEAQVKTCRLERKTQPEALQLDLRKDPHTAKSRLLHRLRLIGVPWGTPDQTEHTSRQGRFHEDWQLKWLPDFEIRLIEAGSWGNTVLEAATSRALRQLQQADRLFDLIGLFSVVLKADLQPVAAPLLTKLQAATALSTDVLALAETILPLAEVLRYGSARQLDLRVVTHLLDGIIPRVAIQLPAACLQVDEDAAAIIMKQVLAVNRALAILNQPDYEAQWQQSLLHIVQQTGTAPLLSGLATRLLFDKNIQDSAQTGQMMRYHLSQAQIVQEAAGWLEGFLYGSGLLLLHYRELWQELDGWVQERSDEEFQQLLPLLRRTFSRFETPEREQMLDLAKHGVGVGKRTVAITVDWEEERAEMVGGIVGLILWGE